MNLWYTCSNFTAKKGIYVTNLLGTQRLINQRIFNNPCNTVADVVQWMGAMQAQDYKQALWAVGTRIKTGDVSDVEGAIANGNIVRTWSQRGTIHFIPAEDINWMLDLCASRVLSGHGRRMRQLELTENIMGKSADLLCEVMDDSTHQTKREIFELLESNGISTKGQRGYHILWHLAHQGLICITTQQGREQSFALVEKWIPNPRVLSRDEALAELVLRYFTSHGPATEYDFARWSGLTLTDTRKGLALNQTRIQSSQVDDRTYWFNEDVPDEDASQSTVFLLPAFDEFLLGYKDRDDVLLPEYSNRVCPGNNGVFQPMIVVDGQIVGIWKRKLKAKSVDITLYPFTTFDSVRDSVIAEAERYGEFMGLTIRMVD